jgi:hypothetical protein
VAHDESVGDLLRQGNHKYGDKQAAKMAENTREKNTLKAVF